MPLRRFFDRSPDAEPSEQARGLPKTLFAPRMILALSASDLFFLEIRQMPQDLDAGSREEFDVL